MVDNAGQWAATEPLQAQNRERDALLRALERASDDATIARLLDRLDRLDAKARS
jgi:hypothetical protein